MRLYRGLKEPYRGEKVAPTPERPLVATDFTDCPLTALRYANARRGYVLVLDIPADVLDAHKFTEALWVGMGSAKRFMTRGKFDKFITAILPAKDLRALIRVKGVASSNDDCKTALLRRKIQERLDDATNALQRANASSAASRPAPPPDRR